MENKDFAVFIMCHDRPNNCYTYKTLRKSGYTGLIYLVIDNDSASLGKYIDNYGDSVIAFNKKEITHKYDSGDNSGDYRSTMYKANEIFYLAEKKSIKYFYIMCDDYTSIEYRYLSKNKEKLLVKKVDKLDFVFNLCVKFFTTTNFKSLAFAQGGDFIGGASNQYAIKSPLIRKSMNTFLCSTDRKFTFLGRLNEDVTTYVNLGCKGDLFGTIPLISIVQKGTQQEKSGLTQVYKDNGTYVKSFFSVMYNPSCVKVSMMNSTHVRIHHSIKWKNTTPMIISEKYKKS